MGGTTTPQPLTPTQKRKRGERLNIIRNASNEETTQIREEELVL